jgi:DHA1 family multidrug resistance protein-like MFS transporter
MSARIWILLVLVAFVMAGNGLIVPVLPIYGEAFSSSATLVGMLITIFGIARLCANYPTGLVYGRVGPAALMGFGNGLLLLGAVGAALAWDLYFLLFCRLVQGFGSGIFLTTMGVVVARQTRSGTRGRFMALYQAAIFIGAGIGPAIGGFIAQSFGIAGPFWAYALVSGLAMVVSLSVENDPVHEEESDEGERGATHSAGLVLRANLFVSFVSGFVRTAALWQLIPLLAATRFSMGFDKIGIAVTVTSLSNVVILPISGWLVDRFGWRLLPSMASFGFAGALVLVSFGHLEWMFWVGVALAGVFGGLIAPATSTALIELTEPRALPSAMGIQRTAADFGFVAGPVTTGLLSDVFNQSAGVGLAMNAALLIASGVLWLFAANFARREAVVKHS